MKKLISLWEWFVISSINPEKISLTVRGIAIACIPFAVILFRTFNIHIGEGLLVDSFDALEKLIIAVGALISASLTLWGFGRKIWQTIKKRLNK